MKKIPTLFKRGKYDGTAALVRDGELFKRYMLRPGRAAPAMFVPVEIDEETGKTVGWVPVGDSPEDKWFRDALQEYPLHTLKDGTYELIGPKVQGNPEKTDLHELVAHADAEVFTDVPTGFDELRDWLAGRDIEGVVWHHPDGRMAKIKLIDFGLERS